MTTRGQHKVAHVMASLLLATTALGAGAIVATPAMAQDTRTYDIPAGPLADVLNQYARQAGVELAYHADLTGNASSPGLKGSYSLAEGLSRILAGTGITYRQTGPRAFTLEPAPTADAGAVQLGPVRVEGQGDTFAQDLAEERRTENPVGPTRGYVAARSETGTKSDTPIIEVPQSISVVSAAEVVAQNAQTVGQALRYVAGVQAEPYGFDARYDQYVIRGFGENVLGSYRDGLRELKGSFSHFLDEPYGLERIEVLRGPSSVLYGGNDPGGVVETVSKRPTDTPFGQIVGQIGNFGRYQGQFDIGGPIASDGSLAYRLTGLARDSGTQVKFGKDDRLFIAPALTWKIDDRTSITVLTDYERNRGQMWPYYYKGDDGQVEHIVLTDPEFDRLHQHQWNVGYQFDHRFSDWLSFHQGFRYGQVRFLGAFVDALGTDGNTLYRYAGLFTDHNNALTTDSRLQAKLDTGVISQTIIVGLDYLQDHTVLGYSFGYPTIAGGTNNVPSLDLTDPVYSTSPVGALPAETYSGTHLRQTGLYVQDQIKVGHLVVTAGGRHDWTRTETLDYADGTSTVQTPGKFTGRVGAVYLFDNGLAPYVSYSTSFSPLAGTTFAGTAYKPTTGRQVEAGVKYQPKGSNSFITASLYTIRQDNLTTADLDHPYYNVQVGRARSRGAEISGVASLTDGLNLVANYSYTDTKVLRSNGTDLGKRLSGVPTNLASLWFDYTMKSGRISGLGFGGGVRYVGKTYQDTANTATNPDYTAFDAVIHYDLPHWRIALNVQNIGDKQVSTCNGSNCTFTQARTIFGSIGYHW